MANEDSPPDEVLLELGRLIWAAINLERDVQYIGRCVRPRGGAFDDMEAGRRISVALDDLKDRPMDDIRSRAHAWLIEARAALLERNAVLHSTHMTYVWTGEGEPPEPPPDHLQHFPRNRRKPSVVTPPTVEGLAPVRERLERARADWIKLGSQLWQNRPKWTDEPPEDKSMTVVVRWRPDQGGNDPRFLVQLEDSKGRRWDPVGRATPVGGFIPDEWPRGSVTKFKRTAPDGWPRSRVPPSLLASTSRKLDAGEC